MERRQAHIACGQKMPSTLPVKAKTSVIFTNNMEGIVSLGKVFDFNFVLNLGRRQFEDFSSFLSTNRAPLRVRATLTALSKVACMASASSTWTLLLEGVNPPQIEAEVSSRMLQNSCVVTPHFCHKVPGMHTVLTDRCSFQPQKGIQQTSMASAFFTQIQCCLYSSWFWSHLTVHLFSNIVFSSLSSNNQRMA